MAKIVLKRKKSDKDTYLVRNVKSAYGELEYDDSLLEEDQVVEPIEKTNEEIQQQQLRKAKEEERRLAEEKAKEEERHLAEERAHMEELQRQQVSAAEVKEIVSDETASILIEKEVDEEKIFGNKKGIINIDTISRNFEAGDIVTVNSLKDKKLIDKNVCFVKVLARGIIDKPLIVKAQDFSLDAAKMIQLTGGKVVLLNKKKY